LQGQRCPMWNRRIRSGKHNKSSLRKSAEGPRSRPTNESRAEERIFDRVTFAAFRASGRWPSKGGGPLPRLRVARNRRNGRIALPRTAAQTKPLKTCRPWLKIFDSRCGRQDVVCDSHLRGFMLHRGVDPGGENDAGKTCQKVETVETAPKIFCIGRTDCPIAGR
jgi:hypothetical protein